MIPIFKPSLGREELKELQKVFESGWIGLGPKTKEFEEEFAKYIGIKHAVALNSCTAALHLAVKALEIKGEIILPSITFVSTAFSASYNDCKPVFADVNEDTLCIDVNDVKNKITKDTKAIIPVHYGGHACEMDELLEIAEENNLYVIEDCAHSCGGQYKNKMTGSLGIAGCFSFHAVKNLATGDGGMLVTDDDKIAERTRKLRWLGINKDTFKRSALENEEKGKGGYYWYYEVEELGYKYHMNDITAAIGLVQLKKLDKLNEKRRKIVSLYCKKLKSVDWISLPVEKPHIKSAWHNFVVKIEKDRNTFIEYLKRFEIDAGVHYMPIYYHPVYSDLKDTANCPNAERVWKKLVTLPLYPDLKKKELNYIINTIKSFD